MSRATAPEFPAAELRQTLERLTAEVATLQASPRRRKKLEAEIRSVIEELGQFLNTLDPIRQPTAVFDPSNPKIVGRFISLALVAQDRHPLGTIPQFYGSGVYAIYYKGSFAPYAPISGTETPIYVGQAAPAINNARTPMEQGARLCGRLGEHKRNIAKATTTLNIDDFEFRSLVVQSGGESAAENYLIHLFRPIWNKEIKILYGIGKHGDDPETRGNKRSPWDTMHSARAWARTEDAKSVETINAELDEHFRAHPAFPDLESVLASFIEELRQV
jgi:hypothetical protein